MTAQEVPGKSNCVSPQAKTFGSDGGPAAVYAAPKLDAFKAHVASFSGVSLDALPIEVSCKLHDAARASEPWPRRWLLR